MAGDKCRAYCIKSFRELAILPHANEYILYLLSLAVGNTERNTNLHNLNARHKYVIPNANLTKYQEIFYTDIKLLSTSLYVK
jgi:hypothetical protein